MQEYWRQLLPSCSVILLLVLSLTEEFVRNYFILLTNLRNRHYLFFDVAAMLVIPLFALYIRLDNAFSWELYGGALGIYVGISLIVKIPVFYKCGLYKHLWRYASIEEVSVILYAVLIASLLFNLIFLFLLPLIPGIHASIPRSVPAIDFLLSVSVHGGVRLLSRIFSTEMNKRDKISDKRNQIRVLIVGAGNSGTMIAKEMLRSPVNGLLPVGFIDDDPRKQGHLIYGIPVLGGRNLIPDICKSMSIKQILIAMPSVSGKSIRAILKIAEPLKIKTRILPSVSELVNEEIKIEQFREVRIDDLLRRETVKTDMTPVTKLLKDQTVMITGAGGSIGSEICRLVSQCDPKQILLLGHGENSIHTIQRELHEYHPEVNCLAVIADIRDESRIDQVMQEFRPSVIYHAAAHKHVPLMEDNIADALSNNVLGTISLLKASRKYGITNFTMISTDKAVAPSSIMGATKRMAEIAMQLAARDSEFESAIVRFGNVLGSRGSVVPIFKDQIAKGKPVTITHPEMRRYFMTIPEAVQLVLQASAIQDRGKIYVLDMGEPERILDLALDLIQLSGLTPYKDVKIEFTGLRPGEKLTEELFREGEVFTRSKHEKIFTIIDSNNGNAIEGESKPRAFDSFEGFESFIRSEVLANNTVDKEHYLNKMFEVVPEFTYDDFIHETKQSAIPQGKG
jgi:FlaA1/EpsC-like NDP-sugar epimerase